MEQSTELIHGGDDVQSISDINVTPFIDVMLVLLIIFMVTAPLMMGGIPVNLPRTSGTPMPRPDSPLIVSLDSENRVFIDKELITPPDMAERFRALALESESGEVYLRGDGEVKYAIVMDLMSQLGQAGFRVTLVTNVQQGSTAPDQDHIAGSGVNGSEAAAAPASLSDTGASPTPSFSDSSASAPVAQ
ncbi:MAG: biopolymer transporter ExbD [Deltaproteobacteria bacterium]|jgi:biopolymer transport protein ExbD|nr:biopolymer transporter ExbD [Deltaproteobacteria bacterium]